MNETLTISDLQKALNLSKASCYRLVKRGILPRLPGLRCIRVSRVVLDEYLQRGQGLSVRVPGQESAVHQKRVQDQKRSPGRARSPQKRGQADQQDPNRHGLAGGHE